MIQASFSAAYSWNIIIREAKNYLKQSLSGKKRAWVIELGSGDGKLLTGLAQEFKEHSFIGIDLNAKAVASAKNLAKEKKLKNVSFEKADVLKYKPKKKFDLAVSLEVLEHVKDVDGFLSKANRLLKKNGRLVLSTPNKSNFPKRIADFFGESGNEFKKKAGEQNLKQAWKDDGHISVQESRELRTRLEKAGFEIKSVSRMPPLYGGRWVDNSKIFYNTNFLLDSVLPRHMLLDLGWNMMFCVEKVVE